MTKQLFFVFSGAIDLSRKSNLISRPCRSRVANLNRIKNRSAIANKPIAMQNEYYQKSKLAASNQATNSKIPMQPDRPARSPLPQLAIYWATGAALGLIFPLQDNLQAPHFVTLFASLSQPHVLTLLAAFFVTILTNVAYDQITTTSGRSFNIPTLIIFSLINGIFETNLFLLSFSLGARLASQLSFPLQFLAGFTFLSAYSGVIHAKFWLPLLPPHLKKMETRRDKVVKKGWMIGITLMTLLWSFLYYQFGDYWSVVALHVLFDAIMVWSIRFSIFDTLQK